MKKDYHVFNSEKIAVVRVMHGYGMYTETHTITLHMDGTCDEYRPSGRWGFSNTAAECAEWIRANVRDSWNKFYVLGLCAELTSDERARMSKCPHPITGETYNY